MTSTSTAVRVRLYAGAAEAAGSDELTVVATTVGELRVALVRERPGLAPVLPRCSVLVDGVAVTDPASALEPGARVDVLPPFAGG